MGMLRLRQIAFVADDLGRVVDEMRDAYGLAVAFRDPGVAVFGLHNAVLPVGNQFVEVVAPTRAGTAAGRYLERRNGDGGYMVILQVDDHLRWKRHVAELGVRIAFQHDGAAYRIMQLHPADTGGSFLEIDEQVGGDELDGPWEPAGIDWQAARHTDVVAGIAAAELQSPDPEALAGRWASILRRPFTRKSTGWELSLDNAVLRFVAAVDGRGEGLGGIDLLSTGSVGAGEQAPSVGASASRLPTSIGGVRVRLV